MERRDTGYDVIRTVAIMCIVIYHFVLCVRDVTGQPIPLFLRLFTNGCGNIGRLGVAWFFILSGSVLRKRYSGGVNLWQFYKKRALRIYIPLWIAYLFFYIVSYPTNNWMSSVPFLSILSPLLGMDFYYFYFNGTWGLNLVGEWFTSVIITIYLLFPLIHLLFSRCRKWITLAVIILFAVNLRLEILTANNGTWSVVNGLVYFWLGMLFETYKKNFTDRVFSWFCILSSAIVAVCFHDGMFGFSYLPTFFIACFSYIAAYNFFLFIPLNPVVQFFSKLNYEIYLIHHRIYYLLLPACLNKTSSGISILCVFITASVAILLLSEKLSYISSKCIKWIR